MGEFLTAVGGGIMLAAVAIIASTVVTYGNADFEANARPGSKAFLASFFSGTHEVPQVLQLVKCVVKTGRENLATFTFRANIDDVRAQRLLVELWFGSKAKREAYVAVLGNQRIVGTAPKSNVLYVSSETVRDLKPAGHWHLDKNILGFTIDKLPTGEPVVAYVRWLPNHLYERDSRQIWTSHVSALLFPERKAIEDFFLTLSE